MRHPRASRSSPRASQYIQNRRSSGSRPEPLLLPLVLPMIVAHGQEVFAKDRFALRIPNKLLETARKAFFSEDSGGVRGRSGTKVFTSSIPVAKVLDFTLQFPQGRHTWSLKIFSICIHFSPGFASGRAFWNLHIRFSHSCTLGSRRSASALASKENSSLTSMI